MKKLNLVASSRAYPGCGACERLYIKIKFILKLYIFIYYIYYEKI